MEGLKVPINSVKTGIDTVKSAVDTVKNAVLSIPQTIIDKLQELLKFLFVPEEGFFDDEVGEIRRKFTFADSIVGTVETLNSKISGVTKENKAPKITVDLSSADSHYGFNYGDTFVIDFSWFLPYREDFLALESAIIWLFFIWRTYKNLPNIINGVGTGVSTAGGLESDIRDS